MENKETKKKRRFPIWAKVLIVVIIVGCLSCVPFLINYAYIKGGGYQTVWNGAEFLAFYGAALSAIGAVFLGAISIWQNKKLREQNEELRQINENAQDRVKELSEEANRISAKANELNLRANELNIINKIIEHEENRLKTLSEVSVDLYELCISSYLLNTLNSVIPQDYNKLSLELQKKISVAFAAIERSLPLDVVIDLDLQLVATKLSGKAYQFLTAHYEHKPKDEMDRLCEELDELNDDFTKMEHDYLEVYYTKLNHVIFKDMTLDEIRRLYQRPQEAENGQDEDGE